MNPNDLNASFELRLRRTEPQSRCAVRRVGGERGGERVTCPRYERVTRWRDPQAVRATSRLRIKQKSIANLHKTCLRSFGRSLGKLSA